MYERSRPGFRFSWGDGLALAICGLLCWLTWPWLGRFALVFPITLGHFFLFCNVFRVRRSYELIWAGLYLLNVACWMLLWEFRWLGVLACQTPLTLVLIVLEVRSSRYHGIWAHPGDGDVAPGSEQS